VANKIVSAIMKDKEQLILPPFVNIVPLARALPVSLFDATNTFFGINNAMDEFKGRGK
jgi:all-trans-retinol dehydrogenase (NAD+)